MIKKLLLFSVAFSCSLGYAYDFGGYYYQHNIASVSIGAFTGGGGGGGGGGSGLTYAWFSTACKSDSGNICRMPIPIEVSTNSLISVGGFVGQTTFTSVTDNRGNTYIVDKHAVSHDYAVGLFHFVATATYIGSYNITLTAPSATSIRFGIFVASNSASSASVDVSTSIYENAAFVSIGTAPVSSASAGLLMAAHTSWAGVNYTITPHPTGKFRQIMEEQSAASGFVPGGVAFSTTSIASTQFLGQWTISQVFDNASVQVVYKTP